MKVIINNETVDHIEKVFDYINDLKYKEAYELIMSKTFTTIDPLIKEWVKALYEFFVCKKTEEAIKLLEYAKPTEIKSNMDFRIYNTLLIFYSIKRRVVSYKKTKDMMEANISKVRDPLLKLRAIYNIAHGFYDFQKYETALKYYNACIKTSINEKLIGRHFAYSIAFKSICLYKIGCRNEAYEVKRQFDYYKFLTDDFDFDLETDCNL